MFTALCHSFGSIKTRTSSAIAIWRPISATAWNTMPLDEFRDKIPREQRMAERVGRSWSARELRRKSFDDLHKLWLVLYKERNMLLTEQQLSRRKNIIFPQPDRIRKVGKSMGAIKHVLGERKRERIRIHLEKKALQSQEVPATNSEADEPMAAIKHVMEGEHEHSDAGGEANAGSPGNTR